jgi:hypothetical protein
MTKREIRRSYEARPFRPFVLCMANGRQIRVAHPEFMATAPAARIVVVFQPDGSFDIVDLPLVTALTVPAKGAARRKQKRKG